MPKPAIMKQLDAVGDIAYNDRYKVVGVLGNVTYWSSSYIPSALKEKRL